MENNKDSYVDNVEAIGERHFYDEIQIHTSTHSGFLLLTRASASSTAS